MKTRFVRLPADERRAQIMAAALRVADRRGIHIITMEDIATEAKVTRPLVARYLGNAQTYRDEIMGEAIKVGNLRVIGQGVLLKSKKCARLSKEKKAAAIAALNK